MPFTTIGDDSARLGRRFFQISLPVFAFSEVIDPGFSVAMNTRFPLHAGDEAFSDATLRCQRFLPFFAFTANAMPPLFT